MNSLLLAPRSARCRVVLVAIMLGLGGLQACSTGPKLVTVKSTPAAAPVPTRAAIPMPLPTAKVVTAPVKPAAPVAASPLSVVSAPPSAPVQSGPVAIASPLRSTAAVEAIKSAPAVIAKPDKASFLWEVSSATNKVYLFGTVHVGKRSFYPLPDVIESAFKSSAKLVVEADITTVVPEPAMRALTHYPPGDALSKRMPSAILLRTGPLLERFKIPVEEADKMKPFMVGALVSMMEFGRLGYEINYGVDGYLIEAAQKRGMPILELESQLGQIAMLSTMSDALQEAFLDNALGAIEKNQLESQLAGLISAWQTGNVPEMQAVVKATTSGIRMAAELDDMLLHKRHPAMLSKIVGYLSQREPHFVAVGSLHLIGPRGLVALLQERGFKIRQL